MARSLSTTEHLALLHAATVLACSFAASGWTEPLAIDVLACLGFLVLVFIVYKREEAAKLIAMATRAKAKEAAAAEEFALAITDVRRNPTTDKVEYRLDGAYKDQRWTAWLRYSTLRQFRGRAGAKADEKFPDKSSVTQWMRGADTDIAFVDERRRMLNKFLKEAVPNKDTFEILAQVPQVRHALGIPDSVEVSSGGGKAKLEDVLKEALKALDMTSEIAKHADNGGDGWNLHSKSSDGISCFLKKEGEFTYAMGKGPMDVDKFTAMEFLVDLTHRKKWDELFKFQDIIEPILDYKRENSYPPTEDPLKTGRSQDWEILGLNIARTGFSSPAKAFVAERDAVTVGVVARRRADGAVCVALRSIDDARAPEGVDGFVRSKVIAAGFLFEDRKDGKPGCILTTMGLVDPNGK